MEEGAGSSETPAVGTGLSFSVMGTGESIWPQGHVPSEFIQQGDTDLRRFLCSNYFTDLQLKKK